MLHLERRITFVLGSGGLETWKLNRLKMLSGYFRSVVVFNNISNRTRGKAENILSIISCGSQENHLCQLWIEGSDAELACMVLTDFVDEHFDLVNTAHRKTEELSNLVINTHPSFSLPFEVSYSYKEVLSTVGIEKYALLSKICSMLDARDAQPLFEAMLDRELVSSTAIGHGIAMPHIMLETIKRPAIALMKLNAEAQWQSKLGCVTTIIAIALPSPANAAIIKSVTQLTRKLIDSEFCDLVTSTKEPQALKAILLHSLVVIPA